MENTNHRISGDRFDDGIIYKNQMCKMTSSQEQIRCLGPLFFNSGAIIFQAHKKSFPSIFQGKLPIFQADLKITLQDNSQIQALFKVCGKHVAAFLQHLTQEKWKHANIFFLTTTRHLKGLESHKINTSMNG